MKNENIVFVIKRKMKALNVNNSQIAKRMNTSPSYITRVLKGDKILNIDELNLFATALETNTMTLLLEASNFKPEMTSLTKEQEESILASDLSYELWNILSIEMSIEEILNTLGHRHQDEVKKCLYDFNKKQLISISINGRYKHNISPEKFIHLTYNENFIARRRAFTDKVLNSKPNFKNYPEKYRNEWLKTQSDVYLIDYFSDEQLLERKDLLRKVWNFVLTQRDVCKISPEKKKNLKLHMFTLIDMEVPLDKLERDSNVLK